jgi:hypothetical protein
MKRNINNNLFVTLNAAEIEALTNTVNETLALGIVPVKKPVFTVVDLWKVQRQARMRPQRRFF